MACSVYRWRTVCARRAVRNQVSLYGVMYYQLLLILYPHAIHLISRLSKIGPDPLHESSADGLSYAKLQGKFQHGTLIHR